MKSVDPVINELMPLNTACPFVGTLDDKTTRFIFPSEASRCHSEHDSGSISVALVHQAQFCLSSCHTNCPRFLGIDDGEFEPEAPKRLAKREIGRRKYLAVLPIVFVMIFAVWRLFISSTAAAESINSIDVATLHTVSIVGGKGSSSENAAPDEAHSLTVEGQFDPELTLNKEKVAETELILSVREPGANLRTSPNTSSEIIQLVVAGSEVVAKGRTRNFWFLIELPDGKQGWVTFSTVEQADAEAVDELSVITTQ